MKKAIIFDFDDTLVKTKESKFAALKHTASKFYKKPLTNSDIEKHYGLPFTVFMKNLFGKHDRLENVLNNYRSIRDSFPASAHDSVVQIIKK